MAFDSVEQSGLNPSFPRSMVTAHHKPDTSRSASNPFTEALESTTLVKPAPSKAII
ncbi:hypothetical protein BT96DRAFT_912057, partial [Gymnopus androsaceus JB14]